MKKIELNGHDHSKKWLVEVAENRYKLEGDLIDYSRVGIEHDENGNKYYTFLDPPGGPMLVVGGKIENKIIESIQLTENSYIITLK